MRYCMSNYQKSTDSVRLRTRTIITIPTGPYSCHERESTHSRYFLHQCWLCLICYHILLQFGHTVSKIYTMLFVCAHITNRGVIVGYTNRLKVDRHSNFPLARSSFECKSWVTSLNTTRVGIHYMT